MIDFLEWIGKVLESGITWSSLVAAFVVYGNWQEKRHIRKMIYLIAEKVGVEWNADKLSYSELMEILPLRKLRKVTFPVRITTLFTHRMEIAKSTSRRKNMNNQNTNFATLLPGLAGVIKLILQSFGLEIPDQHINDILNGVAALAAVIAVVMSHRKPKTSTTTETKSTTTETTMVQPVQTIPEIPAQPAVNVQPSASIAPSTPNDHNQSY